MTDQKTDIKDSGTAKPTDSPLKQPTEGKGLTPGTVGGTGTDWNPAHHPLDGSPVLTAVPQRKPVSGQTGAVPKTVAEHNAEVNEMADARASHRRAGQE